MKTLVKLVTAAIALSACSAATVTGPDDSEAAARAAQARIDLEAASKVAGPSMRLAAN